MNWSALDAALVPTAFVTVTSIVPAAEAGERATIDVGESTTKRAALMLRRDEVLPPCQRARSRRLVRRRVIASHCDPIQSGTPKTAQNKSLDHYTITQNDRLGALGDQQIIFDRREEAS